MQRGYNTGAHLTPGHVYLNKYFQYFFLSNFTPTTKDIHPMSHSLGKPKERLIKKICIRIMKFQSCEEDSVVLHNPPCKDQVIIVTIVNKAQKDCDWPLITV